MKKLTLVFLLLISFSLFGDSSNATKPLSYSYKLDLSSKSNDFFAFNFFQQIDFDLALESISPIDQLPQSISLTFKKIQGEIKYNDQKLAYNSDEKENYSLEFQSLKKLLEQPICIELNKDLSVQQPCTDFENLMHFSSLENYFLNYDLLNQIIESVFAPLKAKQQTSDFPFTIYFPFKSKLSSSITLKKGGSHSSFQLNEPIELEGLYSTKETPSSINLKGNVSLECKWPLQSNYVKNFSLSHDLKEKKGDTLFKNPLIFNYRINISQTP